MVNKNELFRQISMILGTPVDKDDYKETMFRMSQTGGIDQKTTQQLVIALIEAITNEEPNKKKKIWDIIKE